VKNNSDQKGFFSFCFEVFFTYRTNTKNQKNMVTEKEEKNIFMPSIVSNFFLVFTGRRLNHKR